MWPFRKKLTPKKNALREEYELVRQRMHTPQVLQELDGFRLIQAVVEISRNDEGKLGCVMAGNWKSTARAVHKLNKDGTFSKSGVSWTKKNWIRCDPRCYALCVLIQNLTSPKSMKPSRQQVGTIGQRVVEMNVNGLPMMSFDEWKWAFNKF